MHWKKLETDEGISAIVEASKTSPTIIFKHSTRCSISALAFDRLNRSWDDEEMNNLDVFYLDVIARRNISNRVAAQFGIDHESPQLLVIWEGQCVYDNSHMGISYMEIKNKIGEITLA